MHCNGITIVEIIDSVNSAIPNLRYRPMIAASVKPYALAMPLAELGKHCASAQGRNCPQTRFRVAGVSQIAAGYIRLGLLWILSTKADDISSSQQAEHLCRCWCWLNFELTLTDSNLRWLNLAKLE